MGDADWKGGGAYWVVASEGIKEWYVIDVTGVSRTAQVEIPVPRNS